jgi:hypothetical protein
VKEQRIHKGSAFVTGSWVHYKTRRFVQNDHLLVFVENGKGNRFRLTYDRFRGRDFGSDKVPGLGQIPGLFGVSIDRDVTSANQPVRMGAGEGRQARGNDGIESVSSL